MCSSALVRRWPLEAPIDRGFLRQPARIGQERIGSSCTGERRRPICSTHLTMSGVDRVAFWWWPAGVSFFGIMAVMGSLRYGSWWLTLHTVAAILYAVGLGRAVLRRNLMARGVPVDDYSTNQPNPRGDES